MSVARVETRELRPMSGQMRGIIVAVFLFVGGPFAGVAVFLGPLLLMAALSLLAGLEGPASPSEVFSLFVLLPLLAAGGSYLLAGATALITGILLGLLTWLRGRFTMIEAAFAVAAGVMLGVPMTFSIMCAAGARTSCSAGIQLLPLMLLAWGVGIIATYLCLRLMRRYRILSR